jgi:riboflavin synthase alpha subunit
MLQLSRSLTGTTRIGGHFVQGHVDGYGVIDSIRPDGEALWVTVKCAPDILKYIVAKGISTLFNQPYCFLIDGTHGIILTRSSIDQCIN